jgi:hypothetical protein
MAKANCSVCSGGIDTESSPSGMCVRCSERAARKHPLAVTTPKAPAPVPTLPGAEQYPVPAALGGGTLHYTRTPEGEHYGAIVPAPEPVGAVPAVEHKHEPAETHAAHKPHGKKHGG